MELHEKISNLRVELQNANLKKSGYNKYQTFYYFELKDILPKINELLMKYKLNDEFSIEDAEMMLKITDGNKYNIYRIPFKHYATPLNNKGAKTMQDIQYFGGLITYAKRYLILMAYGITDGEVIDGMDNNDTKPKPKSKPTPKKQSQELIDIKTKLNEIIEQCNLEKTEIVKKYKITAETTLARFKEICQSLMIKPPSDEKTKA